MASAKTLTIFATTDENVQIEQLRQFYNDKNVKIDLTGPEDRCQDILEIIDASSFLGHLTAEKDVELVLNSLFSIVFSATGDKAVLVLEKFQALLTSDDFQGLGWQSHAGVSARILSNFFHLYNDRPELQLLTYKNLLKMCGRAHLTNFLETDLKSFEELAKKWNLDLSQKREILRLLHSSLLQDDRADAAAEIMTALLRTYTDQDADTAQEDARECVRTAVVDPKSFSFDHLLRLSAVKRLEKTDPLIHKILELFSTGRLEDYRKFVGENPNFVKDQLKVDAAALEKKIKMLTLISLAESSQILSLAELSTALDISDEWLLEEFIIDAIRINAISGKINELKKELVVTTFQRRTFDRPQWELLQKRLTVLFNNLKESHANIQNINVADNIEA